MCAGGCFSASNPTACYVSVILELSRKDAKSQVNHHPFCFLKTNCCSDRVDYLINRLEIH